MTSFAQAKPKIGQILRRSDIIRIKALVEQEDLHRLIPLAFSQSLRAHFCQETLVSVTHARF